MSRAPSLCSRRYSLPIWMPAPAVIWIGISFVCCDGRRPGNDRDTESHWNSPAGTPLGDLVTAGLPYRWQYRLADDGAKIAAVANFARPVSRGK